MYDLGVGKPTLLVIDDVPSNLSLMHQLLKDDYKVKGANSGEKGLAIAETDMPDLILLDIMMPQMDGYEVCRRLKSSSKTEDIPVIFLTAKTETVDEKKGLLLGAVDYISKPIHPDIVKARIKTHIELKFKNDLLKGKNHYLEKEIARRTHENIKQIEELNAIQDTAFNAMVSLAETRDNDTGNHIRRTQTYIRILAERLSNNPLYSAQLDPKSIELMVKSAPLHDIGKIGIPDSILMKEGPLTDEQFNIMKTHTTLGFQAIESAEKLSGKTMYFLRYAKEIAYSHHECWDGNGYPQGLSGNDIPLSARLMSIADVYDALINKRVYKPPFSHDDAVQIIKEGKGSRFDPAIIDAFDEVADEMYSIALIYANKD
jgi:putative two-component system response regulator